MSVYIAIRFIGGVAIILGAYASQSSARFAIERDKEYCAAHKDAFKLVWPDCNLTWDWQSFTLEP